jgi:hypothetical protein
VTLKFDKIGKWLSHLEARKPSIDTTNAGNSTTAKEQPPPNIQSTLESNAVLVELEELYGLSNFFDGIKWYPT